jgi:protein-tyrosine phosphatase
MSDGRTAHSESTIETHKITHIINVTPNLKNKFPHISYLRIPILDLENIEISEFFEETIDFIVEALEDPKSRVLVHSLQGSSRSSAILAAFLIKEMGFGLDEVVDRITKRREMSINAGFLKQLQGLEKVMIEKKLTLASRVKKGIIEEEYMSMESEIDFDQDFILCTVFGYKNVG